MVTNLYFDISNLCYCSICSYITSRQGTGSTNSHLVFSKLIVYNGQYSGETHKKGVQGGYKERRDGGRCNKAGVGERELDRTARRDRGALGHALRGWEVSARDQGSGDIPFQPTKDPVHNEDLAPERVVGDGRHLPGHPEGPVGGGADAAHRAAVHPGAAVGRRAQRPAGRSGRQAVQGETADVPHHGAPLEQRVRRRAGRLPRVRHQGAAAGRHGRGRTPRAGCALHLRLGPGERYRAALQLAELAPTVRCRFAGPPHCLTLAYLLFNVIISGTLNSQ